MTTTNTMATTVARPPRITPPEVGPDRALLIEMETDRWGIGLDRWVVVRHETGCIETVSPESFAARYPTGKTTSYVRLAYGDAG